MTPDPLHDLDRRASRAATDLRDVAGRRPRPAFDPDRPTAVALGTRAGGRPGRRPLLAVAAAVALVVGGVAYLGTRAGDDDQRPAVETVAPSRPFVATDLPDGFTLLGAADLDETSDAPPLLGDVQLFGTDADHVVAGVAVGPSFEQATQGEEQDVHRFDLDGRTAYRMTMRSVGVEGEWILVPSGSRTIVVLGASLDAAQLERLAAGTRLVDGAVQVAADARPAGTRPIGVLENGTQMVTPFTVLRGGSSGQRYAGYAPEHDGVDTPSLTVMAGPGGPLDLAAVPLVDGNVRSTEVRGHRAVVSTRTVTIDDQGNGRLRLTMVSVTWIERTGELLQVSGSGMEEREVLAAAESVRPAGAQEWADLVRRTKLDLFKGSDDQVRSTVLGEGTFPGGLDWVARYEEPNDPGQNPSINVGVALPGSPAGNSSTSGGPPPFGSTEVITTGGRYVAAGLFADDVTRVEIRGGDGGEVVSPRVVGTGDHRAWIAEVDRSPGAGLVVVAFDAAGVEIGRYDLASDLESLGDRAAAGSSTATFSEQGSAVEVPATTAPAATAPDPAGD